jgi:membrane fusion protein (multidrug efflux system)
MVVKETMTNLFRAKTFLIAILSSIVLFLTLQYGCGQKSDKPQSQGRGGKSIAPVEALIIRPQLLRDEIFTTGTLMANEEVELRSEIAGRVTGVFFEEGKRVRKGDLLIKINDQELQAQFKRKKLEEKLAADNEQRQQSLLTIKGISQEEYDKYLNALKMIQAEREVIESQLAKTEITAPFDGIVGLRYVSEGGYITPDVLVATMQDIDPIKVEFSVPEKHSVNLKSGTEIQVSVADNPKKYQGKLYAIESKIDADTRTIKARATIPNPDGILIPGSYAKVEIVLNELPDAIVIPSEAIVPQINGDVVYICLNGKAKPIPVKTGIRAETNTQVTEGLSAGDTLITSGLLQLADGKGVQITSLKSE